MPRSYFHKFSRALLRTSHNHHFFELVADGICDQVEHPPCEVNLERLALVPQEVRTIYWLWRFQCEAGTGGMDVFILEPLGIYSPQIHAALKTVGAKELVHRLEAAIPFAREGPAEFTGLEDQTWFNQFTPVADFPMLESVNEGIFPLVHALSDIVAAFIRSHEATLFEKDR
jgi:hypothetical protein